MNNPFIYSHSKHTRTHTPAYSNDYRKYKPTLRLEYERQCIYCRFPDCIKGYDAFGVEHYRPKSLYPELETDYSNLFYCCNTCNRYKGNKWPDPATGIFVPNPDEHVMFDHLRFNKETVVHVSDAGEYACELLQLNDPALVRIRKTLLTSLDSLERELADLAKVEKAIRKQFNKGQISQVERDADLAEVESERKSKQDAIDTIAGRC